MNKKHKKMKKQSSTIINTSNSSFNTSPGGIATTTTTTAGTTFVQSDKLSLNYGRDNEKHKYYFKFIVNALEVLPEKPTYATNTSITSSGLTKKSSLTINSFFKQFADAPKLPRTAQLEWKRNSRKRGKLPVCRYQKSLDQNKPDHFIFYTREEKSFDFSTRLTKQTSSGN